MHVGDILYFVISNCFSTDSINNYHNFLGVPRLYLIVMLKMSWSSLFMKMKYSIMVTKSKLSYLFYNYNNPL